MTPSKDSLIKRISDFLNVISQIVFKNETRWGGETTFRYVYFLENTPSITDAIAIIPPAKSIAGEEFGRERIM